MEKGFVVLYRELLNKSIWLQSTPDQCKILITLLLMANHKEKSWEFKGKPFVCKPGQFISSTNKIAERCGKDITRQKVRTALKRFEKLEFLTNQSTKTESLITIVNWREYQCIENKPNQVANQDLTKCQPRPNQDLTTNNNVNNVNNDKQKEKKKEKIIISRDEVLKTFLDYANGDNELYLLLVDFYNMREAKKNKIDTEGTVKAICKKLDKLSSEGYCKCACIENSVACGYTGIFAPKAQVKQGKKQTALGSIFGGEE